MLNFGSWAGRLQSPPARRSFTKETDWPASRPAENRVRLALRSTNSKTVNTLVRARKRQARAAIWSLISRDFNTGSKAAASLDSDQDATKLSEMGWSGDPFSQEASHVASTSDPTQGQRYPSQNQAAR